MKNRGKHLNFAALLLLGLSFFVQSSTFAATSTANLTVNATVAASCTVSGGTLAFGSYTLAAISASTNITATCTNGTAYNIGLSAGGGSGASVTTRKMTSGSNTLNYSLYTNSGNTTIWGNTVGTDTVSATGTGTAVNHTVYGNVPANQTSPIGAYSDTVVITITF